MVFALIMAWFALCFGFFGFAAVFVLTVDIEEKKRQEGKNNESEN